MTPANFITLIRILLVPFFFTALVSYAPGKERERWTAFLIFLAASITDMLDGFLARITKSRTELGRFLDPFADKLLLLSGFLGLLCVPALPYRPPLWITVSIVFRDLVLIAGLIVIYLVSGTLRVEPNALGKVATACQMATLLGILLNLKISIPLSYATAALTILSCVVYSVRELQGLKTSA